MRIVGGEWKGRPLRAPAGRATRPTSDKVREAVFDVLGALPDVGLSLAGHAVLDLFAGSGGLGIEALSRGARSCTFVESEGAALRALRSNLQTLGLDREPRGGPPAAAAPRAVVVGRDVRRALQADARGTARYTLVFADPPYDRYAEVRPELARLLPRVLAPGAVLVVETAAVTAAELPWAVVREKRYGDTRVTFMVAGPEHQTEGARAHDDVPLS